MYKLNRSKIDFSILFQNKKIFPMTWSPNYKQNRFEALKGMKIKDRCDYNRIREYYATLNGQVNGRNHGPEKSVVRNQLFNGKRFQFNFMNLSKSVFQPKSVSTKIPGANIKGYTKSKKVYNVPVKSIANKKRMEQAAVRASVMSAISMDNMAG